jgi:RHS repeat-associated protein
MREHIYLGDDPVAIRERDAPTNVYTYRYLHTDGLGSALMETDATQTVLERSEYEPYGSLTNRAERDDVGFTGHRQDASTGLTYMQQRYYDPQVGRFLSVDPVTPLEQPVGMFNRFVYSLNNPYKFNDPDGRASIPKFLMKKLVMTVKDTLVYADPSVPKSEVDAIVDSMTDVISENYTLGELAEMAIFVFDAKGPNGDVLYKRVSPSDYEALEKMFQSLRKHDPGAAERVKRIMENGIKSGRIRIQEKPNPKPNPKPAPAPKPDPKPNPKPASKTDKPILPA